MLLTALEIAAVEQNSPELLNVANQYWTGLKEGTYQEVPLRATVDLLTDPDKQGSDAISSLISQAELNGVDPLPAVAPLYDRNNGLTIASLRESLKMRGIGLIDSLIRQFGPETQSLAELARSGHTEIITLFDNKILSTRTYNALKRHEPTPYVSIDIQSSITDLSRYTDDQLRTIRKLYDVGIGEIRRIIELIENCN